VNSRKKGNISVKIATIFLFESGYSVAKVENDSRWIQQDSDRDLFGIADLVATPFRDELPENLFVQITTNRCKNQQWREKTKRFTAKHKKFTVAEIVIMINPRLAIRTRNWKQGKTPLTWETYDWPDKAVHLFGRPFKR